MNIIQITTEVNELIPLVSEIWREVFPPIIGEAQTEYMLLHYQSKENILREIHNGAKYCFVELNGSKIGYIAYEIREEYLFISKIYLLSEYRGQGISSKLFDWFETKTRESGKHRLHLHVNKNNEQAIAVYKHKGFHVVDTAITDIGNGYVMDDFFMEKCLGNT